MKDIKVSVIVPVYNAGVYLKECLDTLVVQTLPECEFICINDGSTDNSLSILEQYQVDFSRFRIINQENRGYGAAVNRGINEARGEYIGIVEPDDFIDKEMYEYLYKVAWEERADIVGSDCTWFYDEGGIRLFEKHSVFGDKSLYGRILNSSDDLQASKANIINPACLFRKAFLNKAGIRHNETPGAAFQDRGFCFLSLIQAKRFVVVPRSFYYYRHDNPESSIAGKNDISKVIYEYGFILNQILCMPIMYRKFIPIHFFREYGSCRYALSRCGQEYASETIYSICNEFRKLREAEMLDLSEFSPDMQCQLTFIMDSPQDAIASYLGMKQELQSKLRDFDEFIIYGAGVVGKRILEEVNNCELQSKLIGFAITNPPKQHKYNGVEIKEVKEYMDRRNTIGVVVGVTRAYRDEILRIIDVCGFKHAILLDSLRADI
jgi:glycosyltransferase involved in cell wall biosynthesis